MSYRADIEIAVKGGDKITQISQQLNRLSKYIDRVNTEAQNLGGKGFNVASVDNYSRAVAKAERALRRAADGTTAQKRAVEQVITAREKENALIGRTNYLLAQEVANRRKIQTVINAGFGQQGPALPPSMRNAGFGQQGPALPPRGGVGRVGGGAGGAGGRLGGIATNAIIGGAFPLLFGQGGGAATGGAIGGAIGGLFGGAGGFAGSLLGTLLGQIAGQANQVKELAADIGFSAQQTQLLATAFKQAGSEFDKFAEAVSRIQGLGLSLEQQAAAIQLTSTLTETYKGKIDKVTNAFTNALQTGKVTQATLNQLTSQGIPIQDALAKKYDVSRSKLLEMTKDGQVSVQDLLDTLVDLGNNSQKVSTDVKSSFEQTFDSISTKLGGLLPKIEEAFQKISESGTSAFSTILKALEPLIVALANTAVKAVELYSAFVTAFASIPGYINGITTAVVGLIPGLNVISTILRTMRGGSRERQGPAVPARLQQAPIPRILAPAQLASGGGKGGSKGDKAARDAAREAERVAKFLRDTRAETELLGIQAELQDRIFQAEQAKDPMRVARLQLEQNILDIQFKYANLLANEQNILAQEALVVKGLQEIENARLKTAQNLEKIESDRVEKFQEIITGLERQNELDTIKDERARALREIEFQILDYKKQGLIVSEAEAQIYRDLAQSRVKTPGQKRIEELQTSISELTNVENQAVATAENISQAFGNSFKGIISGSMTAQEALAGFFQSVADRFLDMAAQIIAKWIEMTILNSILNLFPGGGFGAALQMPQLVSGLGGVPNYSGAFPARAAGGPVTGRTPYIVGERGPELFVPNSSGTIVPNNQLGGMGGDVSVVVNVDAKGSKVQGNESQAKALGGAISAAVQAEIVKQQRPGGLLAGTR